MIYKKKFNGEMLRNLGVKFAWLLGLTSEADTLVSEKVYDYATIGVIKGERGLDIPIPVLSDEEYPFYDIRIQTKKTSFYVRYHISDERYGQPMLHKHLKQGERVIIAYKSIYTLLRDYSKEDFSYKRHTETRLRRREITDIIKLDTGQIFNIEDRDGIRL